MELNRLTQKSQQAMQEAQSKALRYGHVEIDGEHLLLALLEQQDGLLPRLLARMDVPVASLKSALEQALKRRPRVSGPGVEPGKIYVTQRRQKLFVQAEDEAKRQGFPLDIAGDAGVVRPDWIDQDSDMGDRGYGFLEQLELFSHDLEGAEFHSGEVATGPRQAGDDTKFLKIDTNPDDDGNSGNHPLGG